MQERDLQGKPEAEKTVTDDGNIAPEAEKTVTDDGNIAPEAEKKEGQK